MFSPLIEPLFLLKRLAHLPLLIIWTGDVSDDHLGQLIGFGDRRVFQNTESIQDDCNCILEFIGCTQCFEQGFNMSDSVDLGQ